MKGVNIEGFTNLSVIERAYLVMQREQKNNNEKTSTNLRIRKAYLNKGIEQNVIIQVLESIEGFVPPPPPQGTKPAAVASTQHRPAPPPEQARAESMLINSEAALPTSTHVEGLSQQRSTSRA